MDRLRNVSLSLLMLIGLDAAVDAASQPDDLITKRIQVALYSASEIDPESIAVTTHHGDVRIAGAVPSVDVKQRIETMVRGTEGVRSLDDALTVDPAMRQPPPAAPPSDESLRQAVIDALRQSRKTADSEIDVRSVHDGIVELGGYAQSLDDQLDALRRARSVPGVRLVQNDMRTPSGAANDVDLVGGQMQGADVRNRRERQALRGQAAETPGLVPGAPTPPRTPDSPAGDTDVENHAH